MTVAVPLGAAPGEQYAVIWAETAGGVTLAVAPLRLLAEPGGVLDQLEAAGLDPAGPTWKADQ